MIKKSRILSGLYYFVLILILANNWFSESAVFLISYNYFKPLCLSSIIILCLIEIISTRYTKPQLIMIILLGLLSLYTAYITKSTWSMYLTFLILFIRGKNINIILNIIFKCMVCFFFINYTTFLIDFLYYPEHLHFWSLDGVSKYHLNFMFANEAARYWIFICLLFFIINSRRNEKRYFTWVLLLIQTYIVYFFTRSETLLLIPILLILYSLGYISFLQKYIKNYAAYSFVIMWFVSCILLFLEDTKLYIILDHLFTGRLFLGQKGIELYGLTLFGQPNAGMYEWLVKDGKAFRMVIDNAFFYYMISYGMIYLFLISILFILSRKRLTYAEGISIIIYSVIALAENNIFSPTAIFPLLIATDIVFNRKGVIYENCKNNKLEVLSYAPYGISTCKLYH